MLSIITGANAGIGKAAALALARYGAEVVMACRSLERGEKAKGEIMAAVPEAKLDVMQVDMASQVSIWAFVEAFLSKYGRLDVLINNAANFDLSIKQSILTEGGVETIFATNHLGPFLMTNLLLDLLKASAPARVINVASKGLMVYPFLTIRFDDLNMENDRYTPSKAYYHSKLAHLMFSFELARRLEESGVTANCIRVPNVAVDVARYPNLPGFLLKMYAIKQRFAITPEQMAQTYLYLATAPDLEKVNGEYFDENNRQVKASRRAYDTAVWRRLWDVSAELTNLAE